MTRELARSRQKCLVRSVYQNEVLSVYGHWESCYLLWSEEVRYSTLPLANWYIDIVIYVVFFELARIMFL